MDAVDYPYHVAWRAVGSPILEDAPLVNGTDAHTGRPGSGWPVAKILGASFIAANIDYIAAAVRQSDMVVAAWGANVAKSTWLTELADEARLNIPGMQCLGVTKGGHPRHPLYVPASMSPQQFDGQA